MPFGMDNERFAGKLKNQTEVVEYMRSHSDEFSPVDNINFPYMNYLYPENTNVFGNEKVFESSNTIDKYFYRFSEKWVPKDITIVKHPVFKIHISYSDDVINFPQIEERIGTCHLRKLPVKRKVNCHIPLNNNMGWFELWIRGSLEQMRRLNYEANREAKQFLLCLVESRIEVYGYVPNHTTMYAHMTIYSTFEHENIVGVD